MQQVKIYIETDSSSPKATEKHYGYVLEVMVSGQAVTREGFGKITGTYHQTVLTALAKALDRFNQSCEVCISAQRMISFSICLSATWQYGPGMSF
jgi:hypothetical protein